MVVEYEEVLKRECVALGLSLEDVDRLLDALCLLSERRRISDQWAPVLSDPSDEAFAQLASESEADCLVTHNLRHLAPVRGLGIKVLAPKEFLQMVRSTP